MGISVHLLIPPSAGRAPRFTPSCFAHIEKLQKNDIDTAVGYAQDVRAAAIAAIAEADCLWLAKNRITFEGICKVLVPPAECLERLASKERQVELASASGLAVLPTYIIRGDADVAVIAVGDYPVCVRPLSAGAVTPPFKVLAASSRHELSSLVRRLSIRDGLIAQPLRALPNVIVHCTSDEGGELKSAAAFLADRKFEGLALRIRRMPLPPSLRDRVALFSRMASLAGCYHFDFLYSAETGEFYFLEVNPRFGGTTDKVIWLGVNEPANCLAAYGIATPRPARMFACSRETVVNKRATAKHLLTALRSQPEPWDYPQESRVRAVYHSLADLVAARDSICDWHDIRGTLAFHLQGVLS
jgi:hypothetical protein